MKNFEIVGFLMFGLGLTLGMKYKDEVGPPGGGGPCRPLLKMFLHTYCARAEGNYGLCRECMPATCLQYVTHPSDTDSFNKCIDQHNRCCTKKGISVKNVAAAAVCYGSGWYDAVGLGEISVVKTIIGGQGDSTYSFTGWDNGEEPGEPVSPEDPENLSCRDFIKYFLQHLCPMATGQYKLCGHCMGLTCLRYMDDWDDARPFKKCQEEHNRCCTRGPGIGPESIVAATACYATGWISEVGEGHIGVVRAALGDQSDDMGDPSEDDPMAMPGLGKRETGKEDQGSPSKMLFDKPV